MGADVAIPEQWIHTDGNDVPLSHCLPPGSTAVEVSPVSCTAPAPPQVAVPGTRTAGKGCEPRVLPFGQMNPRLPFLYPPPPSLEVKQQNRQAQQSGEGGKEYFVKKSQGRISNF